MYVEIIKASPSTWTSLSTIPEGHPSTLFVGDQDDGMDWVCVDDEEVLVVEEGMCTKMEERLTLRKIGMKEPSTTLPNPLATSWLKFGSGKIPSWYLWRRLLAVETFLPQSKKSDRLLGALTPTTRTKLRGVVEGMRLTWSEGIQKLAIQSNTNSVVQILKNPIPIQSSTCRSNAQVSGDDKAEMRH
ncbi:hypothetical protein LINPERHAP2_LOCUS37687 [Linum perenne]